MGHGNSTAKETFQTLSNEDHNTLVELIVFMAAFNASMSVIEPVS